MALRARTLLLIAVSLLTGCAISPPIHEPDLVTRWDRERPSTAIEVPPIHIALFSRRTLFDDRPSSCWLCVKQSKRLIERSLQNSLAQLPLLKQTKVGLRDAPYRLVIEATHAIHSSEAAASRSALSFFLIPYDLENALELNGRLSRDAMLLNTYYARGSFRTRCQLFYLFPIRWRFGMPARMMEETFLDLFLQLQNDAERLFGPRGSTAP